MIKSIPVTVHRTESSGSYTWYTDISTELSTVLADKMYNGIIREEHENFSGPGFLSVG